MKIAQLFTGAHYVGKAEGDRRSYYVFEGEEAGYLVVTPTKDRGFYMNVVDAQAPEAITKAFKGKRLTSVKLRKNGAKRPKLFSTSFLCLNALYVMVALGHAKKLKLRDGKAIVFKIR